MKNNNNNANKIRISLIGIGGGGSNSVCNTYDSLHQLGLNLSYAIINTDKQALAQVGNRKINKILIGGDSTKGMGAGAKPIVGYAAMIESKKSLDEVLNGVQIAFIVTGLGGGTGSGAAPVIAKEAKDRGILTIVFTTFPWGFEGNIRNDNARISLNSLYGNSDSIIVVNNDYLGNSGETTLITDLFKQTDNFLRYAVLTIATLILERSMINIDLNDIKTALSNSNFGFFFIVQANILKIRGKSKKGESSAEQEADEIYKQLQTSYIGGLDVKNSTYLVVNVSGTEETLSMPVIDEVFKKVRAESPKIEIMFGLSFNPYMEEGEIQISGIYSDIDYNQSKITKSIDITNTLEIKQGKIDAEAAALQAKLQAKESAAQAKEEALEQAAIDAEQAAIDAEQDRISAEKKAEKEAKKAEKEAKKEAKKVEVEVQEETKK